MFKQTFSGSPNGRFFTVYFQWSLAILESLEYNIPKNTLKTPLHLSTLNTDTSWYPSKAPLMSLLQERRLIKTSHSFSAQWEPQTHVNRKVTDSQRWAGNSILCYRYFTITFWNIVSKCRYVILKNKWYCPNSAIWRKHKSMA